MRWPRRKHVHNYALALRDIHDNGHEYLVWECRACGIIHDVAPPDRHCFPREVAPAARPATEVEPAHEKP